jgi:cytochrome c-type biogenesis protein CcmH/NrfG
MKNALRLAILALALSMQTGCGGQKPEQHIASAKRMIAKSDYNSASIELKNALKKQGDSAEARWLLGHLYLQTGDANSAQKELQRALSLGWSKEDILPDLARAKLALVDYEGIDQINSAVSSDAAAATILSIQAISALAQGDEEKA